MGAKIFGIILFIGVGILAFFQIRGLIRDIKHRKDVKNKNLNKGDNIDNGNESRS